jgi:signal transduction histidine kinase
MTLRGLRLPAEIEGAGYFTVAESLANSLKHADATSVDIELSRSNGSLRIRVRDDGLGFDPPSSGPWDGTGPTSDAGMGLVGMAERLNAVGGRLALTSTPGRGTTVEAHLAIDGTGP